MSDGKSPLKGLPVEVAGPLIEAMFAGSVIRREGNTTVIDLRHMLDGEGIAFRSSRLNQQMVDAMLGKQQEGSAAQARREGGLGE